MSRKPDYNIGLLNKKTDAKNQSCGAAWANPDGTITIFLDAFIVLHGGRDTMMTLFPRQVEKENSYPGALPINPPG